MYTRLTSASQRFACLCFLGAEIENVYHHALHSSSSKDEKIIYPSDGSFWQCAKQWKLCCKQKSLQDQDSYKTLESWFFQTGYWLLWQDRTPRTTWSKWSSLSWNQTHKTHRLMHELFRSSLTLDPNALPAFQTEFAPCKKVMIMDILTEKKKQKNVWTP